jgi:uncharacterized membrane protein
MNPALSAALLVVVLSGLGTFALRFGGLALADRLPTHGRSAQFLRALPGTLLVALVVPELMEAGVLGLAAAVVVFLVMARTRNLLVAALSGVVIVAVARQVAPLL